VSGGGGCCFDVAEGYGGGDGAGGRGEEGGGVNMWGGHSGPEWEKGEGV